MRAPERTIVIVGGGFCGTVLAANLLRRPPNQPTRLVVVEQRPEIGRGVAYQSSSGECLLNVPAARMSADSRDPSQFVRFAQRRMDKAKAEDYLPRRLYGDYLQEVLHASVRSAPGHIHFERVLGQARSVQPTENTGSFLVEVLGQGRLRAEDVVLACGDPPAVCPSFSRSIEHESNYCADPYRHGALRPDTKTMLVVGTGLTAADTIVMAANLNPRMTIHAISRHGLFPAVQGGGNFPASEIEILKILETAPLSARRILGQFRSLAREVERRGGDWRDAITLARYAAPRLWERLPLAERQRFLRHARVHWDIRRHRLPPAVAARLTALREANQLHVHAGRILGIESEGERLSVRWCPRGRSQAAMQTADQVVNCIGAYQRLEQCRDPLLKDLLVSGLAMIDPLGIGLRTARHGELLGRTARASGRLYYLGPMLRAQYWEATAVGELRVHAEQLAQSLALESEPACLVRA